MADTVLVERDGHIATVVLNRPERMNALNQETWARLGTVMAELGADDSLRCIVLRGAGDKAFAAGTDISQFRSFRTPEDALNYEQHIDQVLGAVERCPLPTVAALAGACTGGGAGIAAACDIRIAARDLKFGFPIARTLGNCLSARNLARLSALLGAGRTREIIFTSRLVEAEEALTAGLVTELLADKAAVEARAAELAALLVGQAPLTLRATKEALRRLTAAAAAVDDKDLIVQCYTSEDFHEGLEAFLGKRKPNWKGR
jgi:enoyl-CoA hydratase/carnithine racemase